MKKNQLVAILVAILIIILLIAVLMIGFQAPPELKGQDSKTPSKIIEGAEGVHEGQVSEFIYYIVDNSDNIIANARDNVDFKLMGESTCTLLNDKDIPINGVVKVRVNRGDYPHSCIIAVTSPTIECGTATGIFVTEEREPEYQRILKDLCPDF